MITLPVLARLDRNAKPPYTLSDVSLVFPSWPSSPDAWCTAWDFTSGHGACSRDWYNTTRRCPLPLALATMAVWQSTYGTIGDTPCRLKLYRYATQTHERARQVALTPTPQE